MTFKLTIWRYLSVGIWLTAVLVPSNLQAQGTIELSDQLVDCLQQKTGVAFEEISRGDRPPTESEIAVGGECVALYAPTPSAATEASPVFSAELTACLEERLGTERFAALMSRAVGEPTPPEKTKAEICFAKYGKPTTPVPRPSRQTGTGDIAGMPAGLMQCLKAAVGEAAFADISAGRRPNATEQGNGEACFTQYRDQIRLSTPGDTPAPSGSPVMSDTHQACLRQVLGSDFERASVGMMLSPEQQRAAAEKCFGQQVSYNAPTVQPSFSPETDRCMIDAFGEELARAMQNGTYRGGSDDVIVAGKQRMVGCMDQRYGSASARRVPGAPGYPSPTYTYAPAVPSGSYAECLKKTLGDRYQTHISGQYNPTESEWQSIKSCMVAANPIPTPSVSSYSPYPPVVPPPSVYPAPINTDTAPASAVPNPGNSVDPKVACLQAALGANYTPYQQGYYYPAADEYTRMQACY